MRTAVHTALASVDAAYLLLQVLQHALDLHLAYLGEQPVETRRADDRQHILVQHRQRCLRAGVSFSLMRFLGWWLTDAQMACQTRDVMQQCAVNIVVAKHAPVGVLSGYFLPSNTPRM